MFDVFQQLARPDADLWLSVGLTLLFAALAVALALVPALVLAYGLVGNAATAQVWWRQALLALVRGAVAVPGITLGLLAVMLLSRSGPLGFLNGLYHPLTLIVVQAFLAVPLLAALFAGVFQALPPEYADLALSMGANPAQLRASLVRQVLPELRAAVGLGWLRVLGEAGAAAVAGGNLLGSTRVLPSAMVLDVQQGNFGRAIGIGLLLLLLSALAALLASLRLPR